MPYTYNDYPESLKNLSPTVRKKAVDILNKLIEEKKMQLNFAIPTSISRARDWAVNRGIKIQPGEDDIKKHGEDLYISPHKEGWSVKKESSDEISYIFKLKAEAINKAREIAQKNNNSITIKRKDGTIQKKISYNKQK